MGSPINYDYGSIDTGVSQMKAFNSQIETKINALKGQVQGLLQEFKGAASSSYDTCAARIQQDLGQSNDRLSHITGNVSRGASDFQSTDAAGARTMNG